MFSNSSLARLSFSSHQKLVNADFCQGEIEEPGNDRIFSYHPMLKNNSNQEYDNAIFHPYLPESIEELVERIIYSVTMCEDCPSGSAYFTYICSWLIYCRRF